MTDQFWLRIIKQGIPGVSDLVVKVHYISSHTVLAKQPSLPEAVRLIGSIVCDI